MPVLYPLIARLTRLYRSIASRHRPVSYIFHCFPNRCRTRFFFFFLTPLISQFPNKSIKCWYAFSLLECKKHFSSKIFFCMPFFESASDSQQALCNRMGFYYVTSGFSSQLFMRIFIRALLLNQTQCGTITVN